MQLIRNKRETGFELLRILAMFLIGAVHVMNYGGMIANNSGSSILWQNLIYSFFTVAVNVFVLISAYFLVTSKFKLKKLLILWIQVFTFSIVSYLISSLAINNNFNIVDFAKCFIPILSKKYWFFSTYFLLYLASPLLNKILHNSSKKELYIICIILFLLSFICPIFKINDILSFSGGLSFAWFVVLYMISGTLKLHPIKIKKSILSLIYTFSTLLAWILSTFVIFVFQYNSPLALVSSVSIFLLFNNVNIKNVFIHNTICYISSLTFGIYLFQESAIKPFLYFNILKVQNFYNSVYSPLAVLMFALAIFVLGAFVELIRKYISKFTEIIFIKLKNKFSKKEIKEEKSS